MAGRDLDNPDGKWDYRGLNFKSPLIEGDLLGEIYPFKERRYTCDGVLKKTLTPYLFAGLGALYTNPTVTQEIPDKLDFTVKPRDLAQDRADLKKIAAVIPFGLGVKYNATERFTIGAEGGYRYALSDYLDGISVAANDGRKDGYFLANVLGSYRFGDKDGDKDGVVNRCDLCPTEPGLRKFQGCPDTDGDGVPDKDDACPTQAGPIGLKGCPDTDGDGIADKDDACPTLVGTLALKGCPDKDKDGVADKDDACPDIAGVKELKGCPDTDGDGIADKDDACPNAAGPASLNGCPDADGDGVADKDDDCVNQKGGTQANGCPDSDGDGVPDNKDLCPDVPGLITNQGCPEGYVNGALAAKSYKTKSGCVISSTELSDLNFAAQGIEFYSGTNKLRPTSYKSLQRVCDVLARCPDALLHINTYNDGGNSSSNVRLAKLRACAIYSYFLKKKCITKSRMSYDGFGDEDPNSNYKTLDGKKSESRVEFLLK